MGLPYRVATLLYCFDTEDRVLLMRRAQQPNLGLWSPCGGKLHMDDGESPYACACREAREEIGLALDPRDLHLTGLVSEHGYAGTAHWLMFLFEVRPRLTLLPPPHREGVFGFFARSELERMEDVPHDGSGADLAAFLAASERLLRGPLPLQPRRSKPLARRGELPLEPGNEMTRRPPRGRERLPEPASSVTE